MGGNPAGFLPAHLLRIGISIGAEQDFFGHVGEPLSHRRPEKRGRKLERLAGEIQVGVRLLHQRGDLAGERPAAVQHHEFRFSQRRIVQNGFEQQRVCAGNLKVAARTGHRVNVNRHSETAALARNVTKQVVL